MTAPDQPDLAQRLRDRIHAIAAGCVDYHATDCRACTNGAAQTIREDLQPELDAKDAEIARLREEAKQAYRQRDYWHEHADTAKATTERLRKRAEAAEDENRKLAGIVRDQQRAEIDLKREVEQLRDENARLEREAIGYRAYHQQIGDL